MKNLEEVLRHKEMELERIQREIDALRTAMRLCAESDAEAEAPSLKFAASAESAKPARPVTTARQFP